MVNVRPRFLLCKTLQVDSWHSSLMIVMIFSSIKFDKLCFVLRVWRQQRQHTKENATPMTIDDDGHGVESGMVGRKPACSVNLVPLRLEYVWKWWITVGRIAHVNVYVHVWGIFTISPFLMETGIISISQTPPTILRMVLGAYLESAFRSLA
jgi:hypothetical protein